MAPLRDSQISDGPEDHGGSRERGPFRESVPDIKLLLQSDGVFKGIRLRYAASDLIRFSPSAVQQIR